MLFPLPEWFTLVTVEGKLSAGDLVLVEGEGGEGWKDVEPSQPGGAWW